MSQGSLALDLKQPGLGATARSANAEVSDHVKMLEALEGPGVEGVVEMPLVSGFQSPFVDAEYL